MVRLTSLLRVEERLLEADYFARRLARHNDSDRFGYELNAFLSAARSVTFVLQKELSKVDGFSAWWEAQRSILGADPAASFFLELRNFSQKQGGISIVGAAARGARRSGWTYRFAGNSEPVPEVLLHRDAAECCREHVAKLAAIVLRCVERFPFHSCPARALTPEGVDALSIPMEDIDEALGLPPGSSRVPPLDRRDRIRLLQGEVDALDVQVLRKLAGWKPRPSPADLVVGAGLSDLLLTALVDKLEERRAAPSRGDPMMEVLAESILASEAKD